MVFVNYGCIVVRMEYRVTITTATNISTKSMCKRHDTEKRETSETSFESEKFIECRKICMNGNDFQITTD